MSKPGEVAYTIPSIWKVETGGPTRSSRTALAAWCARSRFELMKLWKKQKQTKKECQRKYVAQKEYNTEWKYALIIKE